MYEYVVYYIHYMYYFYNDSTSKVYIIRYLSYAYSAAVYRNNESIIRSILNNFSITLSQYDFTFNVYIIQYLS